MNSNLTSQWSVDLGMPMSGRRGRLACVDAPTTGGICTTTTGAKRGFLGTTAVYRDHQVIDSAVIEDVFPGTSVWRPPS